MIAAHTQLHPLLLCGSSRTGRVTSGQNRFTFSLYINCLPALHTSGLRQSIIQFVFGGLLAWGVVYIGEGGGWGGNGVGTGTLQAHRRVWVQVTFAHLRLQGVDHIHSHVEHPQLRLRLVALVRLQHHADPAKLVESVVDVPDPHPLPGIVAKPPVHPLPVVVVSSLAAVLTLGLLPLASPARWGRAGRGHPEAASRGERCCWVGARC